MAIQKREDFIEAGHSIEIEGKGRHYDQSIIEDRNWIILEDVMRMLKVTTARAVQYHADSPTKENWKKKYAKVNGRERVFYSRNDVEKFISSRGPTDTYEAKQGGGQLSQEATAQNSNHKPADILHSSSEGITPISQENFPSILLKAGETSPEIAKFVDFHMKIVDENKNLKTQAHKAETEVVGWKTSLYWLIGVSLFAGASLTWFGLTNWSKVGELTRTKDDLYTKTISLQDEVIKTKSTLLSRDAEIQQLKQPIAQTINTQQQ